MNFFATFNQIRKQTFIKSNIQTAFRNTGLDSSDPDIVIEKLLAIQQSERAVTPSLPFEDSLWWLPSGTLIKSFKTPKSLIKEARQLQK